jgi:hypothetical protein
MSILSPSGVNTKGFTYTDFMGVDSSRDKSSLDTGEKQHLLALEDGFCDWRGAIVRNAGVQIHKNIDKAIDHVRFYSRNNVCFVQQDGGGLSLNSDQDHLVQEAFTTGSVVTSTVFNQKVFMVSKDQSSYVYNGSSWNKVSSLDHLKPAYCTSVGRRLAVAGITGKSTEIHFSRVDDENFFTEQEEAGETSVTRGAFLDIKNFIGTADEIKGLGVLENNKLCIFTNDQVIIFNIEPNFENWILEDKVSVQTGTISHNSIVRYGTDLIYCGRDGIHSVKRSMENGVTIFSESLSSKVDIKYRELLAACPNLEKVSSTYDADEGHIHFFFPKSSPKLSEKLTYAINPVGGDSKWSTGGHLNSRCGDFLGGELILGTSGGLFKTQNIEEKSDFPPTMIATTPILWHGSLNSTKESTSFILHAHGFGELLIECFNDKGQQIDSINLTIDDTGDDNNFPDVPLTRQYERQFLHRYKGVQFKFTSSGSGILRIMGLAINVRD